jgi:hypothetical protein
MIRIYPMPWILGYTVMSMLYFPLESEIVIGVPHIIGKFVN